MGRIRNTRRESARILIIGLKPLGSGRHSGSNNHTSEFLKWTGRFCLYPFAVVWYSSCWLGTVSLTINLSVLQPKNPRKRWGLPGSFSRCEVGDPACTFPWGPKTDHPCSLPASPDTSDDVVTDRGHTDPVKNGDAFEILGIMTILADRKDTVKGSDNLS